jgi:hypothetical protein
VTQPLLAKMSLDYFHSIPRKVIPRTVRMEDPTFESDQATAWIVDGYAERFLYKNEAIMEVLGDSDRRTCATKGQQILYALIAFDGQIKNGGIEQFFWNGTDIIPDVSEALRALDLPELQKHYDRAVETLLGKKDDWNDLRNQAYRDPEQLDWEPFRQSYAVLDLDSFNDNYYDQYDPGDNKTVVKRGLSSILMRRLRDYVVAHANEFFTSSDE